MDCRYGGERASRNGFDRPSGEFKNVPKEIEEAVSAMSDPIALESLLVHAIDSETLDEFETAL